MRYTIADLAAKAEVSPRLISEFELGKRPHVSLATAVRLLNLVGVELRVEEATELAQTQRAEHRRRTWVGVKTTLRQQSDPVPPVSAEERLAAVAQASRLAVGLQQASQ